MSDAKSLSAQMYKEDRAIITAHLKLTSGAFLQPTAFPDIGSCIYTDAQGRKRCLIESEQSMANRLEAVCMKAPGRWVDALGKLPVIEIRDQSNALLATNLTEPHRIASSYLLQSTLNGSTIKELFEAKLGLGNGGATWPIDRRNELEKLVFALDPAALLHGFQFVQWDFVGLRQTRLLSGRLECELAEEPDVQYGMVKFDAIEPENTTEKKANKGQSIAAKSRVVPAQDGLNATFDIDLLGLRSLSLIDDQKKFLLALALWKIGAFLSNKPAFDPRSRQTGPSLRLRADCYVSCGDVTWSKNKLELSDLVGQISHCRIEFDKLVQEQGFAFRDGEPPVIQVNYNRRASATAAPTPEPPAETSQADEQSEIAES